MRWWGGLWSGGIYPGCDHGDHDVAVWHKDTDQIPLVHRHSEVKVAAQLWIHLLNSNIYLRMEGKGLIHFYGPFSVLGVCFIK